MDLICKKILHLAALFGIRLILLPLLKDISVLIEFFRKCAKMRSDRISKIIIEDRKMLRAVKNRLLVMLAMDIDQIRPDRLENRYRHRPSIDTYQTSTVFTDLTKKDQCILFCFDTIFCKHIFGDNFRYPVKNSFDHGLIRVFPNIVAADPVAEKRTDRVDNE